MFDVIWTDPNRELVGERILRKEREEREGKSKDKDRKKHDGVNRNSTSTNSSSSSEKGYGFFGSKNRKKTTTPTRVNRTISSSAATPLEEVKDRRLSAYAVKALLLHEDDSQSTVKPSNGTFPVAQSPELADGSSTLSSRGTGYISCACFAIILLIHNIARVSHLKGDTTFSCCL